ncbi:hypothetical protein DYB37_005378 [Aphanomyces astaci]|uniref:Uncharacterized protein n=1 Tax=Aphanomyces astaci TaxID=112090 RepID=A0A3L6VFQ5_APHAT|nr:hypothetical protein DYB35_004494 [Aphanomyces astaci]RHZ15027.1 hypothetical protein DYB37_005378 [Aphanomyces astaci]RLO07388.1 hypothetical protein DYB28_003116 [Aphanomyces astaci]
MHRVSDQLEDRYPYKSGFREEHDATEVSRAYGSHDIGRYCQLLSLKEDLADEARIKALSGLADLLANQENKAKAVAAGVIPSMSRLMTVSNPDIRLGSAAVNLTTSRDGIPIVLSRSYIPEKLVAMASSEDDTLTTATVLNLYQTFGQLTKSHAGAQALAQVKVVPALVRVLQKPLSFPSKLLRHVNEGKLEAIKANVVELTIKVLSGAQKGVFHSLDSQSKLDLIRIASGALMALSTAELAKPKLLATGIDVLVGCLLVNESKQNAIQALNYMCEDRSGLLPVVALLLDHPTQLLVQVFSIRATQALNTLLEQQLKSPQVVLQAILAMVVQDGGVDEVTQCLNMLDNVTKLCQINADAPQVPALATQIIKAIAEVDGLILTLINRALERHKIAPAFVHAVL